MSDADNKQKIQTSLNITALKAAMLSNNIASRQTVECLRLLTLAALSSLSNKEEDAIGHLTKLVAALKEVNDSISTSGNFLDRMIDEV